MKYNHPTISNGGKKIQTDIKNMEKKYFTYFTYLQFTFHFIQLQTVETKIITEIIWVIIEVIRIIIEIALIWLI